MQKGVWSLVIAFSFSCDSFDCILYKNSQYENLAFKTWPMVCYNGYICQQLYVYRMFATSAYVLIASINDRYSTDIHRRRNWSFSRQIHPLLPCTKQKLVWVKTTLVSLLLSLKSTVLSITVSSLLPCFMNVLPLISGRGLTFWVRWLFYILAPSHSKCFQRLWHVAVKKLIIDDYLPAVLAKLFTLYPAHDLRLAYLKSRER